MARKQKREGSCQSNVASGVGAAISRMRGFRKWQWHADEMYVQVHGEMVCLWRAVDHEGEVLESYIAKIRDKAAALRFLKKALKRHGSPEAITTDGLRFYKAAISELGSASKQQIGRHANNQAEIAIARAQTDRAMLRFRKDENAAEVCLSARVGPHPFSSGASSHRSNHIPGTLLGRLGRVEVARELKVSDKGGSARGGDWFALD